MAVQKTLAKGSELTGTSGTLKRLVINPENIYLNLPRYNIFGVLFGGKFMDVNTGEKKQMTRRLSKTDLNTYNPEIFKQELVQDVFEVTSGATSTGTSITLESGAGNSINTKTLMGVIETNDVFYVTAVSTDTLTISRITSVAATISAGQNVVKLGEIYEEGSTSPGFVLRDPDRIQNFTAEFRKAWKITEREWNVGRKGGRYGGNRFIRERKNKSAELLREMESYILMGEQSQTLGSDNATSGRGFIQWAKTNGQTFDFGGTVERPETYLFGATARERTRGETIILTSGNVIARFMQAWDGLVRFDPSEFNEIGLRDAKRVNFGPLTADIIPTDFFNKAGNDGTGIVIDTSLNEIGFLQDLIMRQDIQDNDELARFGEIYADGAAVLPLDSGLSTTYFTGANG